MIDSGLMCAKCTSNLRLFIAYNGAGLLWYSGKNTVWLVIFRFCWEYRWGWKKITDVHQLLYLDTQYDSENKILEEDDEILFCFWVRSILEKKLCKTIKEDIWI